MPKLYYRIIRQSDRYILQRLINDKLGYTVVTQKQTLEEIEKLIPKGSEVELCLLSSMTR